MTLSYPRKILICNDDGFFASGIVALREVFCEVCEVWKIAPEKERSGTSHAMNFHQEVALIEMEPRFFKMKNGFPADCVNVGLHYHIFPDFDLVISGINHGPNLGQDIFYSGTVGAARQAAIHSIPSIAISNASVTYGNDVKSQKKEMLHIASWLKDWLYEHYIHIQSGIVYNINYPYSEKILLDDCSIEFVFTTQGKRKYFDEYTEKDQNSDKCTLELRTQPSSDLSATHTDVFAIASEKISITPLSIDCSNYNELNRWKAIDS